MSKGESQEQGGDKAHLSPEHLLPDPVRKKNGPCREEHRGQPADDQESG